MQYLPLGPLVLAGSGEYTPSMDLADRYLLDRANGGEVLLIATSCAQEGDDVMTRWEQMGVAHFRRLGVEATPLRIRDATDANKDEFAARIAAGALIWFSGGSPAYLAEAFNGTASWHALEAANRNGAAVAGASGGLGVLNQFVPDPAAETPQARSGLGLASPVRALAHFDRMEARRPEFIERIVNNLAHDHRVVGVDEDTAAVWTGSEWQVMGHKRVVVFQEGGQRTIFSHGERIDLLPPPFRSQA